MYLIPLLANLLTCRHNMSNKGFHEHLVHPIAVDMHHPIVDHVRKGRDTVHILLMALAVEVHVVTFVLFQETVRILAQTIEELLLG